FSEKTVKGEIVLVIDRQENQRPKTEDRSPESLALRVEELEKDFDHKSALKKAAKEFGLSRSEAYRMLISEKNR
ncbi:MAG TPA: hypothetical protein VGB68_14255, partial [Pyrinomonadaceae bacterium]